MKARPTQPAEDWFYGLPEDGFAIPQAVVFEKYRGFEIRAAQDLEDARALDGWFEGFLATLRPDQVLAPDNESLRLQARMWSEPELKNFIFSREGIKKAKTGGDLIVAAIAIRNGMPVATFNVADFQSIDRLYPLPGIYHPGRD